jgi:hypothetical protein
VKVSFEQAKSEAAAQQRALMQRMEGFERVGADASAKLAALTTKLETIERQTSAAAGKAAAADPAMTGAVPDANTKYLPLEGWVLHDVQRGVALVENSRGRLYEIVVGQHLPTLGRVEAIEQRGRSWVVVTQKGVISGLRWQ